MNENLTPEDVIRYKLKPGMKAELTLQPAARTTWIGFNFKTGPFAGIEAGKHGRHAFITSVDMRSWSISPARRAPRVSPPQVARSRRASRATSATTPTRTPNSTRCSQGRVPGLDPTGSKVKGLVYTYNATAFTRRSARTWPRSGEEPRRDHAVRPGRASFFSARNKCTYPIFRHSWGADYDHPQDCLTSSS